MDHEGVEAIIVTRRSDVQYLTGYESPQEYIPTGCLVVKNENPRLIVSELQRELLVAESVMGKVLTFQDETTERWYSTYTPEFWKRIVQTIRNSGVEKSMIGLQHDWLTVDEFDLLKNALPGAGFKDYSPALYRLRQVKDHSEIDTIRRAISVAEIGIRTALEIVTAGKTESEASLEIEAAMRGAGGQRRGIRAAVLTGSHARYPFAQPGHQRIEEEDLVIIDITVSHLGYFAEIARTVHAATPSKEQSAAFKGILDLTSRFEEILVSGTPVREIGKAIYDEFRKEGPDWNLYKPYGNSIGLDLIEPPFLMPDSEGTLREGMVLSMTPICADPEQGAVKISDMYLITENGPENLTNLTRETM
jgi:Xaa-Pro aminopeptidase